MKQLIVNYDIPLWGIIAFIVSWVITLITAVIRLYYSDKTQKVVNKNFNVKFNEMEKDIEKKIETSAKTFNERFNEYKQENKEKFTRIEADISEIKSEQKHTNNSLAKIEAHVELLVLKGMNKGNRM